MDLQELIDRLEELVQEGRSLPFLRGVLVDEERLWDLIDQMRISIPDEVRKAQQIMAQKDRIIAQAQERAKRIIQRAQQEREALIEESEVVQEARARAEQVLEEAQAEAERIRREAESYALHLFQTVAAQLRDALNQVEKAIAVLEHQALAAEAPAGEEGQTGEPEPL